MMKNNDQLSLPQHRTELINLLSDKEHAVNFSEKDIDNIYDAYVFAQNIAQNKTETLNHSLIVNALMSAKTLATYQLDDVTLVSVFLGGIYREKLVSFSEVSRRFGVSVAEVIQEVDLLEREVYRYKEIEKFRKLFLTMISDVRVVFLILANRLTLIRSLVDYPRERKYEIANETLHIFAPLAERMGIWRIKAELEDTSFYLINPEKYSQIASQLQRSQKEHQRILTNIIERVRIRMHEVHLPVHEFRISGRPKHIYSIYKKLHTPKYEGKGLERIYDKLGVRIIVNTISECYTVLSIIHHEWVPLSGEFDDYISKQLPSGYQSLHTAVQYDVHRQDVVEFQIRTHGMHHEAEYGVAAHWIYKERAKRDIAHEKKVTLLRRMVDDIVSGIKTYSAGDTDTNVDSQIDILQEKVYVLTPKDNIIELPKGATPIDFAYYVHTDLGHKCRGAFVNGKLLPLHYKLQNGDQIEIVTAKQGGPSLDWLNSDRGYIVTHHARSKVRNWFRKQAHNEQFQLGQKLLEKELKRQSITINHEIAAKLLNFQKPEEMFDAIGKGDINPKYIARKLIEYFNQKSEGQKQQKQETISSFENLKNHNLFIHGLDGLLTQVARCCNPVLGDPIIGFVTRGRGVTIHRTNCPNIAAAVRENNSDRLIDVQWPANSNISYPVRIQIDANDRIGLVRDISNLVADEHINMRRIEALTTVNNAALINAELEIKDTEQLERIFAKLRHLPNIVEIRRISR